MTKGRRYLTGCRGAGLEPKKSLRHPTHPRGPLYGRGGGFGGGAEGCTGAVQGGRYT